MAKIPYSLVVGSLMYAMVCTQPDIAYAVGVVSRYKSWQEALGGSERDHVLPQGHKEYAYMLWKQRGMCKRLHGCRLCRRCR